MRDEEIDQLLQHTERATAGVENSNEAPIDEGVLLAYRANRLSEAEAEAVERRLVRDPEARALLRELSQDVSQSEVDSVVRVLPTNVISLASRRRRVVTLTVATLAAAAGLTVILSLRTTPQAGYLLEVEGGTSATRGDVRPALVLTAENRLLVRLRAERASTEPRVMGVFVEGEQGQLLALSPEVAQHAGSFEATLTRANLGLAPGHQRLWLLVAEDPAVLRAVVGRPQRAVAGDGLAWHGLDLEVRSE